MPQTLVKQVLGARGRAEDTFINVFTLAVYFQLEGGIYVPSWKGKVCVSESPDQGEVAM